MKNCYKAEKEKHRETKMAYADIAPKAPRSVQKAQVDMNIPESLSDSAVHNVYFVKYIITHNRTSSDLSKHLKNTILLNIYLSQLPACSSVRKIHFL